MKDLEGIITFEESYYTLQVLLWEMLRRGVENKVKCS
jgi:hypothetical protein